jgi:imidazole glycerol-phosphate synthase subunit HisH
VIALLDYGAGNLRSVHKALHHLEAEVRLVTRPEQLAGTSAAVLPGVGAFDDCMHALRRQELLEACREFIQSGRPFLGICVGYQALFERSTEFNSSAAGMGLFAGSVVRFQPVPDLKIPQIGWNQVRLRQPGCPLFRDIPDGTHFYFVHSYFPQPADPAIVAAETHHGQTFASAIAHRNVFATQFHPEKSQQAGLQLLRNFLSL